METRFIVVDDGDNTLMGQGKLGWLPINDENLQLAKLFIVEANARRHIYIDTMRVVDVQVEIITKVSLC